LLRAQRGHEQAYERSCRAFIKVHTALVAAGLRPAGGGTHEADETRGAAPWIAAVLPLARFVVEAPN
jgi:hypothetical protein